MSEHYPDWQRAARTRLRGSLALSAIAIAALIWFVDLSRGVDRPAAIELRLLPEVLVESREDDEVAPVETAETVQERSIVTDELAVEAVEPPPADDSAPAVTDWYGQIDAAVVSTLDNAAAPVSVNPGFDRKRREAATRFAPSRAPRPAPIWEDVETDQLGRKVLVSGDCYRVIDDPSAVNYEIFRTFQQHLVQCARYRPSVRELPWVADLRDRYDYLAGDHADDRAAGSQLTAQLAGGTGSPGLR